MEQQPGKGISRRSMMKRLGAGAAIAWSTPILTSIKSPAFAQFYVCQPPCTPCQFGQPCGPGCACVGVPSPCYCASFGVCTSPDPICRVDADCDLYCGGPGGVCAECEFVPDCAGDVSCWCPCGSSPRNVNRRGVRVIRAPR